MFPGLAAIKQTTAKQKGAGHVSYNRHCWHFKMWFFLPSNSISDFRRMVSEVVSALPNIESIDQLCDIQINRDTECTELH